MELFLKYVIQLVTISKAKVFVTSFFIYIAFLMGGFDDSIEALFMLAFLDYVLGFVHAWKSSNIKRKKMIEGVYKFILYCIAIIAAYQVEKVTDHKINFIHDTIVWYLGAIEFLSICNHLSKFGIKLPMRLIEKIEGFRDDLNYGKRKEDHSLNS